VDKSSNPFVNFLGIRVEKEIMNGKYVFMDQQLCEMEIDDAIAAPRQELEGRT